MGLKNASFVNVKMSRNLVDSEAEVLGHVGNSRHLNTALVRVVRASVAPPVYNFVVVD